MTTTKNKNRAALVYVRKSQARTEAAEAGLGRQEEDCRQYAERHGLQVAQVRQEVQSAYGEKKRPIWSECLEDLASGKVGHLIVWRLDRASRRGILGLAEVIDAVDKTGGTLHSVTEQLDLSTAMGKAMAGVIASMAEQESSNISQRVKRAVQQQVSLGKKHAGQRQFGFESDGTHRPEEVGQIREIAGRVMAGESLRSIATRMNEQGIPTVSGSAKGWSVGQLSVLLKSPALRGIRIHNGIEHQGSWDPIFTPEEHAEILSAIRSGSKRNREQSLLGNLGLLRCGSCNSLMRAGSPSSPGKSPRYTCATGPGWAGCGKVAIVRHGVEKVVRSEFIRMMDAWEERPKDEPRDNLTRLLEQDQQALKELVADRYVHRRIDDLAFQAAHDQLLERIQETEALIASQPVSVRLLPVPGSAEEWWDSGSIESRRAALKGCLANIQVMPQGRSASHRFNSERVRVNFAFGWIYDRAREREILEGSELVEIPLGEDPAD